MLGSNARRKEVKDMKRAMTAVFALVLVMAFGGLAFGWWGGPGMGYGPGCYSGGMKPENMKKFQKETLGLRDELIAKQIDLEAEYDKASPDQARITALRKDIIDLEARVQVVADKYGTAAGAGMGRGMRGGPGCNCRMWY